MQKPYEVGGKVVRLVSLYDILKWCYMEPFKAVTFYTIGRLLQRLEQTNASLSGVATEFAKVIAGPLDPDAKVDSAYKEIMTIIVSAIEGHCDSIKLCRATQYADDILNQLKPNSDLTTRKLVFLLGELDKHIQWDMQKEQFMYIPPSSAKYYNLEKPFGDKVYDAFPAARFDLTQAGNCLAAGVYTASGMHLMRGAEVGLWELGRDRQIPVAKSNKIEFTEWGLIISELETAIQAIQQWPNSVVKEDAHKFYNKAVVEIRSFNDGIRRHLAHVRPQQISMEEDEALANWGHVTRFLQTLAAKISEGQYTDLVWK